MTQGFHFRVIIQGKWKHMSTKRHELTWMLIASLFIVLKIWQQVRCLSIKEWLNKLWFVYVMENSTKKNGLLSHIIESQNHYVEKKARSKDYLYCIIPFIWSSKRDYTWFKTKKFSDSLWGTGEEVAGIDFLKGGGIRNFWDRSWHCRVSWFRHFMKLTKWHS